MIELKSGASVLGLLPENGGCIAYWNHDDRNVFYPTSDPRLHALHGQAVCAYPLVPYSNRINRGQFTFKGEQYNLTPNFGDEPHTIHGNGWERAWKLLFLRENSATLRLDHTPPRDPSVQWPFCYQAELTYELNDNELVLKLTLRNTDEVSQPVGIGYHPYFPRGKDLNLGFVAQGVWSRTDKGFPDRRVDVTGKLRFEPMRPIGDESIDHCYDGWGKTLFMRWPSIGRSLTLMVEGAFSNLIVYAPLQKPYITAEPVSHIPDAINHPEIKDSGLVVLEPGKELSGRIVFSLSAM